MRFLLRSFSGYTPNPASGNLAFILLLILAGTVSGFGCMGPISASFGDSGLFCAIDASGKQAVLCWDSDNSSATAASLHYSTELPSLAALSGGEDFLCGILSNTSQAICWDSTGLSRTLDLVPQIFRPNAYSHIAAGKDHVCAIRGSYYSDIDSGSVDCWDIVKGANNSLTSAQSSRFYDQNASILVFRKLVSGNGFTCGIIRDGGLTCWGPNSSSLGISGVLDNFLALASGLNSICGISQTTSEIQCWGDSDSYKNLPVGIIFMSLSAGLHHFCGIREDNHGIECWGEFNASSIPKHSGFLAIASSNSHTCGIREGDLVLDCWFTHLASLADYDPPLQLCSPGLCTARACGEGMFAFNASLLNEPDLTSLCVRKDLKICSPCGLNCTTGFFLSSLCTSDADRVCTPCSLCQNSSCEDVCKLNSPPENRKNHNWDRLRERFLIIGPSATGILLILLVWHFLTQFSTKKAHGPRPRPEPGPDHHPPPALATPCPGPAQVFRLSELKDATNGFKEFNELGRGSYGFVYRAILPDGRAVAVKRANAATIIHTNGRAFDAQLEILCGLRHANIVNLLGYCSEMGERLLVYELMPNGSLHDHLHGGLSGLRSWARRLRIALQAANGLEYLHTMAVPPIAHRDVRSCKILLDADWGARVSDFGLLSPSEREDGSDVERDVYGFGVMILEILCGRKAYDEEFEPPDIVEWAVPRIRQGKAAAIIDRYVPLPRNVEPLLRLADIAEVALREDPRERASLSDLAVMLEKLVKDGSVS